MKKIIIIAAVFLFLIITGCGKNTNSGKEKHNEEAGHGEENERGHAEETHAGEGGSHSKEQKLSVDQASRKIIGLELKEAGYRAMENTLEVTGEIAKDTENIFHVTPKTPGEIIEIKTAYGNIVKEGAVLAVIKTSLSSEEIVSPANGMITGVTVKKGHYADGVTSLFTISDLSVINANFDIYEKDIGRVRIDQRVKVKSIAYPSKVFSGKIMFISPRVDEISRTIKIRAEIDNREYLLKFSMYVTGNIIVNDGQSMSIPSDAVQKVKDKHIVFVLNGDKEFIVKEITAGYEDNGYIQVLSGLKQGDKIAAKGSFMLKSEMLKSEMGDGCAD